MIAWSIRAANGIEVSSKNRLCNLLLTHHV
jgi:hypothetical protein